MTSARQTPGLLVDLDSRLGDLPARSMVPGFTVGVVSHGERTTRGFGAAELGTDRAVEPDTPFGICSVTKPFTATLAMSLVEDGLLDLDRPMIDELQTLGLATPEATATVTLRHLLTHTGGFASELETDLFRYGDGDDAIARALPDYRSLHQSGAPGTAWSYCNTGYWLVAALVTRVTGMSFEAAMRERVLEPMGLGHTGFPWVDTIEGLATPHPDVDGEIAPDRCFTMPRVRAPSGGLVAPVGDLLTFAEAHMAGRDTTTLSAEGFRSMVTDLVPIPGGDDRQGLGWVVSGEGADQRLWHDGSYGGFESLLVAVPGRSIAVAVLTNGEHGNVVWRAVRDVVLG